MANEQNDIDNIETREWLDALASVIQFDGPERAAHLLQSLQAYADQNGIAAGTTLTTPYINTIAASAQTQYPGDLALEAKIAALIRWNAIAMVMRAGKKASELGGHIASYASAAVLYEVGFNHFFKGPEHKAGSDLVYYQGHASPGVYGRAFLEGRFTEKQLDRFRQEVKSDGLSSYPHPWLMPDFWEFPTVSMGLGPLQSIYQARFLKYLYHRGLADTEKRQVWTFCGDGEMDEPESLGAITLAGREKLDNLIFVINCNLQRLDGPVRGNGKIIQELESVFRGAGWHVIKVVWDSHWDKLISKDKTGLLIKRMGEVLDGEYQNYPVKDAAYMREHFFGKYPELQQLVADMSDEDLAKLGRGGHDSEKVFAAYSQATQHQGQPVVILAKTVKGYGMGTSGEGLNTTHQTKKMDEASLKSFCQRFDLAIPENKIADLAYHCPDKQSAEYKYLMKCRKELGGVIPQRRTRYKSLTIPSLDTFAAQLKNSGDREISTTMAFVRILTTLLKDKNIGKQIVPIVPDESRTFGMEGLFRQVGIYSSAGQLYDPVDADQLMYYREATDGQILQEGINEPGAISSWIAAATSYATNDLPMIPFYIYYSMFGPQRVGDLVWAAGDMQARGFLLGGTAGRTTLAGEGLQHQDGHSPLLFATIPNAIVYDPTYAYEMAVIIHDGMRRMYQQQENIFYYLTALNENYQHPDMPEGAEEGIVKGLYRLHTAKDKKNKLKVQLLGSGSILREVIAAAELLRNDFDIESDIWSATSFNELRKEALEIERWNRYHPDKKAKRAYVTECLADAEGPVIAATDYMKAYADQVRAFIPQTYTVLGTDGYGRSDTRVELRHFFEVNRYYVVIATLKTLADMDCIPVETVNKALKKYKIDTEKPNPVTV